jgi:predicted Zn-dependent peptidase
MTEETLKNVTLADVVANYENYFVPENAYLVIIGDVKYKEVKPIVEKLLVLGKKSYTKTQLHRTENVPFTQINFVDTPNAVQSEISLVNTNLK